MTNWNEVLLGLLAWADQPDEVGWRRLCRECGWPEDTPMLVQGEERKVVGEESVLMPRRRRFRM